jgi:hypothetical protein
MVKPAGRHGLGAWFRDRSIDRHAGVEAGTSQVHPIHGVTEDARSSFVDVEIRSLADPEVMMRRCEMHEFITPGNRVVDRGPIANVTAHDPDPVRRP